LADRPTRPMHWHILPSWPEAADSYYHPLKGRPAPMRWPSVYVLPSPFPKRERDIHHALKLSSME
jgi:hypothetical protein